MSSISSCTDPGYITKLSLDGTAYHVFAYIEEANGSKRFLPASSNLQSLEKIRNLATGLLQAHDARRTALSEAKYNYALTTLDSRGLIKPDHSVVSHDFLIQPVENNLANRMASALSSPEQRMEASAVKAKDVWTSLERMIRNEIGSLPPPPATPITPTAPINGANAAAPPPENSRNSATTPAAIPVAPPATPPAATTPANPAPTVTSPIATTPTANPATEANAAATPTTTTTPATPAPPQLSASTPQAHRGSTPIERILHDLCQQPNWYDKISDRIKLRIVSDIVNRRSPAGGIYEEVWKLFEAKAKNGNAITLNLLDEERRRLSVLCKARRSPIPTLIRDGAEALIDSYYTAGLRIDLQEKIVALMTKEFAHKEQLFQCIREQAITERVVSETCDRQWAEDHYIDNLPLFVRSLIRWLDNN